MMKTLSLLLAATLLAGLVGCVNSVAENSSPSGEVGEAALSNATPAVKSGDTADQPITPVVLADAEEITFKDLELDMKEDDKFRESLLTDRVKELDGKRVRLKGYIHQASLFQSRGIEEFVFVRNTECKFGPGATAHHNIIATVKPAIKQNTVRPITLEGKITVDPYEGDDGNTWAVYRFVGSMKP